MTIRSRRRELELEIIATARAYTDGRWGGGETLATLEDLCWQLNELPLEPADKGAKPSALAPDTSWEAYRSMKGRLGDDATLVLDTIFFTFSRGRTGLTTEEVCQKLDRKHQSISARVNELRDRGWIIDSTLRRKTTSGRDAIVWTPTTAVANGEPWKPST